MSFLSGIVGDVVNIAEQAALAYATGGASLLETAAQDIVQQAASGALSQFGQSLGLDQGSIDSALQQAGLPTSGSVDQSVEDASQNLNLSPYEQGQVSQQAQQTQNAYTQMFNEALQDAGGETAKAARSGGKGAGMSVLQAIAYAMGKAMDSKLDDMAQKAQQLGDSQSGSSQYGQLSSEISADGQELSMMSSAVSNAIKSIGDAGSELAKKE